METLHIETRRLTMGGPQSSSCSPSGEQTQKRGPGKTGGATPRTPQRSQTVDDYQPTGLPDGWTTVTHNAFLAQSREQQTAAGRIPSPITEAPPSIDASDSDTMSVTSNSSDKHYRIVPGPEVDERPRRPALPPPRRSYSVMDYEPVPHTHRPSALLALTDLPSEVHYAIFDHLDPIDSTCLGLTNSHFYAIHRHLHGTVPLPTRRSGPNDLEWAWHLAGTIVHANRSLAAPDPATAAAVAAAAAAATGAGADKKALEKKALAMLRVRGHVYCRKCGISRCELHRHIRDWMGDEYEYCSVRQKFGPKAPEGVKNFCYLSNPKKSGRCGRHPVVKARPAITSEA